MKGHWENVSDTVYQQDVLPFIDRFYNKCLNSHEQFTSKQFFKNSYRAGIAHSRLHRWQWRSDESLNAINVNPLQVIDQCLQNRTMGLVGDSMSIQLFTGLVCTAVASPEPLSKTVASSANTTRNITDCNERHIMKYCIATGAGQPSFEVASVFPFI